KTAWESGNPISRNKIYMRLIQKFGNIDDSEAPSEFCCVMKLNERIISPSLAQWVRVRLEGASWSIRKESVSQKVPTNWVAVALEASNKIRAKLKAYIEFIVPTGTRRVGSNVTSDAKKGCTVMVSAEMYSSMILPPFIVMTATHNGTLARRSASWRDNGGDASDHFQPSHWMDTPTTKKVYRLPHKSVSEMIDYLELKGLMYEFIAELVSTMQICDLYANRPLKTATKNKFLRWKVSQTIPPGGKYKVDRVQVIRWVEEAVLVVNEQQETSRKVEYMFNRLGQDPRQPNN
ncbi:hypothetical protein L915_21861, partial [Phytophthora nicotianae]